MSYQASMEMVGSYVEVTDKGETIVHKHVLFTDTEGNSVKYPWESLKRVVLDWIEVENDKIHLPTLTDVEMGDKVMKALQDYIPTADEMIAAQQMTAPTKINWDVE